MSKLPVVAIAGATGRLGKHTADAFLSSPWRQNFSEVVLLSRSATPSESESWTKRGATVRTYGMGDIQNALHGVNILVNVISGLAGPFKSELLEAAATISTIKLYFPSEYGVDHGDGTDPDYDIGAWQQKKAHVAKARKLFGSNVKICSVYISLFLELTIGPFYGMDATAGHFEAIGSADTPVTFTSLRDTGKALASLSSLAVDSIPDIVRIHGDSTSLKSYAEEVESVSGKLIKITTLDLAKYKQEAKAAAEPKPFHFLRFLMGQGSLDFSQRNHNDLVNPNGTLWQWTSVPEIIRIRDAPV